MPQLPTRDQLRVWREFIETTMALHGLMAAQLQADAGLSPGDYAVLLALSEAPGQRMRPSALGREIGWERSRVAHHLGRMAKRGLITREGAVVVLAEVGARAFHGATRPHLRAIKELFVDALSAEQMAGLAEATRALQVVVRERHGS
jgi:DNA-binding MarR family transcriptional regulator